MLYIHISYLHICLSSFSKAIDFRIQIDQWNEISVGNHAFDISWSLSDCRAACSKHRAYKMTLHNGSLFFIFLFLSLFLSLSTRSYDDAYILYTEPNRFNRTELEKPAWMRQSYAHTHIHTHSPTLTHTGIKYYIRTCKYCLYCGVHCVHVITSLLRAYWLYFLHKVYYEHHIKRE